MPQEKTVIAVCGPTAVGKTDHAIQLARKYSTEILSADSRQCYKELNIGVARPSVQQLSEIKHFFINSHSIFEDVNAATFEQYGLDAIEKIFAHHDVAILTGGTGLYVKAFLEGLDEIPGIEPGIEDNIRLQYQTSGMEWLSEQVRIHDPEFFKRGENRNPQRMMRALAVMLSTGKSILKYQKGTKTERPFKVEKVFMQLPRAELNERINRRVDKMMKEGLLEEARSLFPHRHLNALQTVGYSELFDYFDNKITLEKAIELIKQHTRNYAKRQTTWFKKYFVDSP